MKIVIDIKDDDYYDIIGDALIGEFTTREVINAIRNGTPLPKGHGRLVDADALEKDMVNGIKSGLYEEGYETFAHINDMDDCVECVKYVPTIIEADKAECEEEDESSISV